MTLLKLVSKKTSVLNTVKDMDSILIASYYNNLFTNRIQL